MNTLEKQNKKKTQDSTKILYTIILLVSYQQKINVFFIRFFFLFNFLQSFSIFSRNGTYNKLKKKTTWISV